jgi:hypothetical protein
MNDKIEYLRKNQHLAEEPFFGPLQSNCWGTVCYVLGIENRVEDVWESWLDHNNTKLPNKEIILAGAERPGYVGQHPMDTFIQLCTARSRKADIAAYYNQWGDLVHCAIPLEKGLVFHQYCKGGPWETVPGNDYIKAGKATKKELLRIR